MCYNSKCIPAQCGVPGITCNGNTATKGLACMNRLCVKCTKNDDCYKVQFPNTQPTLIPGMKCDLTPNSPTNGQCKSECSTNTECETKSNNSTSIVIKLKRKCGDAQDYSQSCKTTGIGCTCVYETCTIGPNPQCAQGAACLSTSSSSPYFGKDICTYCVADNDCKDAQYKTCIANQCKQP